MRCPTPRKKAYDSREVAVFFAQAEGLRAYRCPCGRWHLSSMPKQGAQVAFRGAALSVGSVAHDHDTSPVRIELESLAGRK